MLPNTGLQQLAAAKPRPTATTVAVRLSDSPSVDGAAITNIRLAPASPRMPEKNWLARVKDR